MTPIFQALVARMSDEKNYTRAIEERFIDDLSQGEGLILAGSQRGRVVVNLQ